MSAHLFHPNDSKITIKFDHYTDPKNPFSVFKINYSNHDISIFLNEQTLPDFLKILTDTVLFELKENKEILNQIINGDFDQNEDL